MIMRWISEVPSKMVKIVDYATVSAGRWPAGWPDISTDSAPVIAVRPTAAEWAQDVDDAPAIGARTSGR